MRNLVMYLQYKALAMISYCLPFVVVLFLNKETFLRTSGTSLSFFGCIAVVLLVLAFKSTILEYVKKDFLISFSAFLLCFAVVAQFLADQLLILSVTSLIGCVLIKVFEPVADVYYKRCYRLDDKVKTRIRMLPLPQREAWKRAHAGIEVADE